MAVSDMSPVTWRRCSHSGGNGECVEVANLHLGIGVRDSKAPGGGHLTFTRETWSVFVTEAKVGRYDQGAK